MSRISRIQDVVLTRSVTLTGSDMVIKVPKNAFEVNIKSGSTVTYKEKSSGTYVEDGITYGAGYTGTNMWFPVSDKREFVLNGTGMVELLFSCTREV